MTGSEKKKSNKGGDASAAKKLRVCDPDLRVVIKYNEGGKPAEKIYHLYSQIVSRISNFFDTSLSVEMKEKASGEIVFQDVTPKIFEKALKFQQDSRAIRSMSVEDAVELVEFYDKYEFVGGLELCDDILSEYILSQDALPENLDLFVRTISLAMDHNLPKATLKGVAFLKANFEKDPENPFGLLPLNSGHLTMLEPFFKQKILGLPNDLSLEDLDNPLFTKLYLKCRSTHFLSKMMQGGKLELRYANFNCGSYHFTGLKSDPVWMGGNKSPLILEKPSGTDDWVIKLKRPSTIVWKCPGSWEFDYPPQGPWLPDDGDTWNLPCDPLQLSQLP